MPGQIKRVARARLGLGSRTGKAAGKDPHARAERQRQRQREKDVAISLFEIDSRLEEDALVHELGPELAREPGARLRVWCAE